MYVWESGAESIGRVRREHGTWGVMVTMKRDWYNDGNRFERVTVNEGGTCLLPEEVRMAPQLGSVGASCGYTINLGNYESARVDVWKTLPCKPEDADETYDECYQFVSGKVGELVVQIRNDAQQSNQS